MLIPARFKQHCAQLVDPNISPEARKDLATEVRDSIELVHSQEYASFLLNFLPAFRIVLTERTRPQPVDNTVHKTRALILEILNRLPHNDVLRTKILDMFTMAMDILKNDNEENAVTAIHIIFDLHKNYRHHLGGQVQPFLDFVRRLYESFEKTVAALLPTKPPQQNQTAPQRISPSSQSFKVITECPLLVMFVFQLYPHLIRPNIQHLLPLMVGAIQVEVPVQLIATSPKNVFQEFIASQVKTVSFLAYLLKQFPDLMKADEMSIPRSVVKLMQTCPGDSVLIRKELLVATRHILTSPFRRGFFDQIDLLLDERVLVGTGRAATDTLRPLAYSFLAELVHCVRLSLSIPQLEKIIFLFSTNVHDPKFSFTLQTSSVRLLLNLIEGILKVDPEDVAQRAAARQLLIRILETMVSKYVTLGEQVPRLLEAVTALREKPDPIAAGKRLCEVPIGDPLKEIADFKTLLKTLTLGLKTVIWSAIKIRVPHPGSTRSGAGAVLSSSASEKASVPQRSSAGPGRPSIRTGLLERECEIVSRLLSAGKSCFRLYSRHEKANGATDEAASASATVTERQNEADVNSKKEDGEGSSTGDLLSELSRSAEPARIIAASAQEEREVFDQFAQIFTVLDPPSFQDVFGLRISDWFEYTVENAAAITIPQHFLANSSVSKYFADILFTFLVENMSNLDIPYNKTGDKHAWEARRANCLLKLFKILFASVSLFPANEPVLRLHLQAIVRNCLKCASKAADPHAYLQMLRALFKSITSGKHEVQFELLYRDFMPLVEPLFSNLLTLYEGPSRLFHKELIIELCLMIPARPSTIFPHLEQQIKPIVWALEGGRDNPTYGLRTLEFWVDMLQPGYLDMLLAKVEPDLTRALHRHLRPPGNAYGPAALRILGKLGSRSRNHKLLTMPFKVNEHADSALQVLLSWPDGMKISLETDRLIYRSAEILMGQKNDSLGKAIVKQKVEAWKFLFACLCPFLGLLRATGSTEDRPPFTPEDQVVWSLYSDSLTHRSGGDTPAVELRTKQLTSAQEGLVSTLLVALISSSGNSEIRSASFALSTLSDRKKTSEECILGLCKYFAMVTVQSVSCHRAGNREPRSSGRDDGEASGHDGSLKHTLFVDALIEAMSLEDRDYAQAGLDCLKLYISEIASYCLVQDSTKGETTPQPSLEKNALASPDSKKTVPPHSGKVQRPIQQNVGTGGDAKPGAGPTEDSKQGAMVVDTKMETTEQPQAAPVQQHATNRKREGTHRRFFPAEAVLIGCLNVVLDRLCHCCHRRSWNAKWAGVNGLDTLVSVVPAKSFASPGFAPGHMQIVRALLFLARDSLGPESDASVAQARSLLSRVVKVAFARPSGGSNSSKVEVAMHSKKVRELSVRLALELSCESTNARMTARVGFDILGDALKRDVSDVVASVKDQILRPIQQRPIRQHSLSVQIGYLESVNYCLQLGKPVLAAEIFASPLRDNFLIESMYILDGSNVDPATEAEDVLRHKYHDNKYFDPDTARQLLDLKRKVLELLCNVSVHCSAYLQETQNERLFHSMISCFFRSLQSRDEEVVQSAKRGLKQAISKHPKPKELLQHNLRPILGYLADYKKLTIQYLQGLSRVLELFSHWFNVSLGEKLLEHLQRWTEPEKIAPLKKTMPGTESRIAAAILDLFHLLPSAASKFLEQIVDMVLRLESVLALAAPGAAHLGLKNARGASTSPYRAPLLKYCNQHAAFASKFFLSHLDDERKRQLFFVMIRAADSDALRRDIMDSPKRLLSSPYFSVDGNSTKSLHVISVIDLLSRHNPQWLRSDPEIKAKLIAYWRVASSAAELRQHNSISLSKIQAVKTVSEIFIRYCTQFPEEIGLVFELLPVFSTRTVCDFTFVKEFLKVTVTRTDRNPKRKAVISKFLSIFQDKNQPQERKVYALQYIVTPMITNYLVSRHERSGGADAESKQVASGDASSAAAATSSDAVPESSSNALSRTAAVGPDGSSASGSGTNPTQSAKGSELAGKAVVSQAPEEVLDQGVIQRIMKELLDQPDDILRCYDEPLSAELLRLATALIRYMPKELGRYRKELIKFGWNHLKREDSVAKHWAFVNVSRFFEAYPAPAKIILQVYVALLRACQVEGRELVQQALDVLTPALPRRLVHNPADHKYPIWIRYTKKILLEEGHSVPNLVHIWQLIARHRDLFYVARAQFVPIMVNSLNRIGLNAATAAENRRLALDLVDLILKWETTRRARGANPGDSDQGVLVVDETTRKRAREEELGNGEVDVPRGEKGNHAVADRGSGTEPPAKTRKSDDAHPIAVSNSPIRGNIQGAPRDADDFRPGATMVEMLINFLIQVPFRPMDRREMPFLTRRCVQLLGDALSLWPDAPVRLGFIEKLLVPLPVDSNTPGASQGQAAKAVNPATPDFTTPDTKVTTKNENQKNDKAEHARLKRAAVRHSALLTALLLASVLTKHQGSRFLESNATAIRALVAPAVAENSLQAASQFSSLLKDIIHEYSAAPSSTRLSSSQSDPRLSAQHSAVGQAKAKAAANVADQGRDGVGSAKALMNLNSKGSLDSSAQRFLTVLSGDINVSIETCLQAADATKNHCGLLVLKSFAEGLPREVLKYQELLAKTLHRMTKENLNASQPSSTGGGSSQHASGSSGMPRVGTSADRTSAPNANQGRGGPAPSGAQTSDPTPGQDTIRNQKGANSEKYGQQSTKEMQALVLCLSLLGENISTLEPGQRKTLFHLLWALIDRCVQVEVLLEIVRVVGSWVFWKPRHSGVSVPTSAMKEPLSSKEKIHFLLKMVIFERISGHGSQELMDSYLRVILRIFGGENPGDKRPELTARLERAFMLGLKTVESSLRGKFFKIYNEAVGRSLAVRLNYVVAKQDWEHLADTMWIKHASEMLISAVDTTRPVAANGTRVRFADLTRKQKSLANVERSSQAKLNPDVALRQVHGQEEFIVDATLLGFAQYVQAAATRSVVEPLITLLHEDSEIACSVWTSLFSKAWERLGTSERGSMEKSLSVLLTKEFHQIQISGGRNNVQALLEGVVHCTPQPALRADVVRHLGSRWNAWHTALSYLERREEDLQAHLSPSGGIVDERFSKHIAAQLEDIADGQASLFASLNEPDYTAGLWKRRARNSLTEKALCQEQVGLYADAQGLYSKGLSELLARATGTQFVPDWKSPGRTEATFWEERWIDCARRLCQWEVLTEFSRTVVNSQLLHECLWRLPDWSALKELLIKNPVEDGPQLKLYQAYVQLQENKLDVADNFITQGYHKAQEKFCSLPETADMDACAPTLVQFQQLVELQESGRILSELNALSRQGSGTINVEQKIDSVRLILNTWRERMPSQHEPLPYWNDILTWRNHVHAVVVNVLDALKEAANAKVAAAQAPSSNGGGNRNAGVNAQAAQVQAAAAIAQALPQQVLVMGVNETAWNVHRFAKACRKQGYPDVALYILQKLYPFGTMELSEYFVKTKETARSFMAGPKGLEKHVENGLHELSRCNMDHFNARQKAQLFTVKGKLFAAIGKEDEAVEAFCTALHTSADVGSAWLAWGRHCDHMQNRAAKNPASFSSYLDRGALDQAGIKATEGVPNAYAAELALRESAVNCYLQAAKFGSRKTRAYLPRVLRLMTIDMHSRLSYGFRRHATQDQSAGNGGVMKGTSAGVSGTKDLSATVSGAPKTTVLQQTAADSTSKLLSSTDGVSKGMRDLLAELPAWMWLPWLSQMVLMLGRKEGNVVEPMLMRVAEQYPQAIFFPLRSYMEDRRQIDTPKTHQHKEALKLSRPIAPPLRSAGSPAHLSSTARQAQAAKESVQRTSQRFQALRKEMEEIAKALAASEGTPEHAANLKKKGQVKNELVSAHRALEKYMTAYHAASKRHRQIQESIAGGQVSNAAKPPTNGRGSGDGSAKPEGQRSAQSNNGADQTRAQDARRDGQLSVSSASSTGQLQNKEGMRDLKRRTAYDRADSVMTQLVKTHQALYLDMERIAMEISFRVKPQREEHLLSLMNALLHRCYLTQMKVQKEVASSFRSALEEVSRMCFGTGLQGHEGTVEQRVPSGIADLKAAFEAELAPQVSSDFPTDLETFIARLRRWQSIFQRRVDALPDYVKVENVSKHLLEICNSDVEVFGQYADAVEISEPSIEKHTKISRFCSDLRILRRPSGPSRGIRIIGSNGRSYYFVLETSVNPNVQASEDRTAQMYRLLNSCIFAKDAEASRRRIHLKAPVFVATGARSRLVSDDPSLSSLSGGLDGYLERQQRTSDDLIVAFRRIAFEAQMRRKAATTDATGWSEVIAARVEAYRELCNLHMPENCLSAWVKSKMPNATANFIFRKRFAETLGSSSLVSYALAIGARKSQSMLFSWTSGALFNVHMRILTSPEGVIESDEAVPFRLTRNIQRVLGPLGVKGPFFGCMAAALQTMRKHEDILKVHLEFVLRDELAGWVTLRGENERAKATQGNAADEEDRRMREEYKLVEKSLEKSVAAVGRRMRIGETGREGKMVDENEDACQIADALIAKAVEPKNLAQMESSWQAWY